MPADLNRVTIIGRLTKDPEARQTADGGAICSIRLASTARQRSADGTWGDKPNYFDVTVFGRQAETANQYLTKGRRIGIDGRLAWREWTAQDGSRRQAVEIVAGDVFFLDSGMEARPAQDELPMAAAPAAPAPDDDLPF